MKKEKLYIFKEFLRSFISIIQVVLLFMADLIFYFYFLTFKKHQHKKKRNL